MHRDKELLITATKIVKDFACNTLYKLPASSFQKIAKDMIRLNRIGDGGWIARSLMRERQRLQTARQQSRQFGFAPFANLGFYTYRWIKEQYAGWVLPLMAKKLDKPEDIYATWGVQFADAMDALGKKACEEAEHLYQFVTQSPAWEEAQAARKEYLRDFKAHKRRYELRQARAQKQQQSHTPSFLRHSKLAPRFGRELHTRELHSRGPAFLR